MAEFEAWPKIPRLNRECVVTEKIDGTNAAVVVEELVLSSDIPTSDAVAEVELPDGQRFGVYAQSRKRLIQPNGDGNNTRDNYGFAAWVKENALELAAVLGKGHHFGEWWGSGIQRGYDQTEKRFSLFNSGRWHDEQANGLGPNIAPKCCSVVPVLATGSIIESAQEATTLLEAEGSAAAPGFDNPEGFVVYHTAARSSFKVTLEGDASPKGIYKGMHSKLESTS